jgi:hypothetical protein
LVAALRRLPVILAGPAHLHRLRDELNVKHVVAVPPRDCYRQWRRVADEILAAAAVTARPCVVSVSASMPAELIVDYAHERVGEGCSVIDFGSLWDPFVGMRSRRYHRGMTPATLRANLHGWD